MLRRILPLLALTPALFAADPPVKLETASAIEICSSCSSVQFMLIPDAQSTIKVDELPVVERAFLGAAPKDATKFPAKWVGKPPRAIEITVDVEETKQAGTYDLYLNLQPTSNLGAPRLKVQLIRPAATLDSIPKLIVNRTYWFLGWKCDTHPRLLATETSHKSGITISGIRPISNASVGTKPIGGMLNFADKQPAIAPGQQVDLNYKLDGDFELGAATGTMKIEAPQFAAPVAFDFEVRSRVHWIYIGITIAVGLIISYLVKVKLQQSIELDQARLDARTLLEKIEQEAGRHVDPAFAAGYQNQLTALQQAMNGNSPGAINDAKLLLDTAWRAAITDFANRHQSQVDALNKLRDITNVDWIVPPEVAQAVVRARAAIADVVALIDRDALTDAAQRRTAITTTLGDEIRVAALNWQTGEQQILAALQGAPAGISAAIAAALAKPASDLLGSLHKVDATTALFTPEQIQQTLSDVKVERTAVQQFFQWLSTSIEMEYAKAQAQIPNPPAAFWDAPTFARVGDAVAAFTRFLRTLADVPDGAEFERQLTAMHQAWTSGLRNQFPNPNAAVQAPLDAHDYVQATTVAYQQRGPAPVPGAVAFAAPTVAAAFVPPSFQRDMSAVTELPRYAIHTLVQTIATPAPAVRTSVTDAGKLKKDKLFQSLIVGSLLIVAGYGLQLTTFVGTFTDFSTLFFWAFALDLTVDQVSKVTKKA